MNSGISQNDLAVLVNFVCWNGVLFIMRLIAFFLFWFLLKEKGQLPFWIWKWLISKFEIEILVDSGNTTCHITSERKSPATIDMMWIGWKWIASSVQMTIKYLQASVFTLARDANWSAPFLPWGSVWFVVLMNVGGVLYLAETIIAAVSWSWQTPRAAYHVHDSHVRPHETKE